MLELNLGSWLLILVAFSGAAGLVQQPWTHVRLGSETWCQTDHELAVRTLVPSTFLWFHLDWDPDIGSGSRCWFGSSPTAQALNLLSDLLAPRI